MIHRNELISCRSYIAVENCSNNLVSLVVVLTLTSETMLWRRSLSIKLWNPINWNDLILKKFVCWCAVWNEYILKPIKSLKGQNEKKKLDKWIQQTVLRFQKNHAVFCWVLKENNTKPRIHYYRKMKSSYWIKVIVSAWERLSFLHLSIFQSLLRFA